MIPKKASAASRLVCIDHPLGAPDPSQLAGLGHVRLLYNVSLNPNYPVSDPQRRYGNTDLEYTFSRYYPHIKRYVDAGLRVILVFTHQTYGEGREEFWPWYAMTTDKWKRLSQRFSAIVADTAQRFKGHNLVYQVWNEMDAQPGAVASVPMLAEDYAILLCNTIQKVKAVNAGATVISRVARGVSP